MLTIYLFIYIFFHKETSNQKYEQDMGNKVDQRNPLNKS